MKEKCSACSKAAAEPLNRYGPRIPQLHHQVVIMGPYGWSPSPWWRPLRALEEFSAMGVFSLESLLTLKFLDPTTLLIFSNLPASLLKWDGNWCETIYFPWNWSSANDAGKETAGYSDMLSTHAWSSFPSHAQASSYGREVHSVWPGRWCQGQCV